MNTTIFHLQTRSSLARLVTLAGGLLALGAASAHAQSYNVSLNTTGLTPGDSYAIDLQLNQGGTTPASTVNVTNFLFGGGSAGLVGSIMTSGTASGSLSSGVSLGSSASPAFNDFTQNFNNGSSLGFTVNTSQLMAATGGTPDQFLFDLYDNTQNAPVATNDSLGGNFALFTLTRGAGGTYSAQNFGYTSGGTIYTTTSAPAPVPEASTALSFGLLMGLFGLGVLRARRGQVRGVTGTK